MKHIEAAGAVVLRDTSDGQEVLVVHRPRYDDWSLPKGKLDPGETLPQAAVREVAEETGTKIRLLAPLDRIGYRVGSAAKQVSWWRGLTSAVVPDPPGRAERGDDDHDDDDHQDSDAVPEVDQISWLSPAEADKRLNYDQDRFVLAQAAAQPITTPLIVVRHAKAINRKDWDGTDAGRPLRPRGRMQSRRLAPLLDAYGVAELITSPWQRCVATLQPYALQHRIRSVTLPILNEDEGSDDPTGVAAAMDEMRERAVVEHRPIAVCGHRPVLPHMLSALDLPERALSTAECVVVHLTDTAEVHAVELHRPRA